mgnify:CR=1 FL=1
MAETSSDIQRVIEVPRVKRSSLNLGNILIGGGIGYLLFKTFLLEERVEDLTVMLKRQSRPLETSSPNPSVTHTGPADPVNHAEDEYETSDDGDGDDHPPPEHRTHRDDDDGEDEVQIEEQPREVPPYAEIPTRNVAVGAPRASAFVTTRQRRSGSELRRDSSRTGASTREA